MQSTELIQGLLEKHGLTQRDVAVKLDVSEALVNRWLNGKNVPLSSNYMALVRVLREYEPDLSLDDLLAEDG